MRHLLLPSNANAWSQRLSQPGGESDGEERNGKCKNPEEKKDGTDYSVRSRRITLSAQADNEWDEHARERPRGDQLIDDVWHFEGCEVRVESTVSTEGTKEDDQSHPTEHA
jgi:hypothetical protein